jgi:hypothetical protein
MWLEQTIWIWGPVTGTALLWLTSRVIKLGHELRSLRMLVTQLEQAGSTNAVNTAGAARNAA